MTPPTFIRLEHSSGDQWWVALNRIVCVRPRVGHIDRATVIVDEGDGTRAYDTNMTVAAVLRVITEAIEQGEE